MKIEKVNPDDMPRYARDKSELTEALIAMEVGDAICIRDHMHHSTPSNPSGCTFLSRVYSGAKRFKRIVKCRHSADKKDLYVQRIK